MEEIWASINNNYQVSNLGRVKSLSKLLKPQLDSEGYYNVYIGQYRVERVHRLVAKFHIINPFNYKCVNHKDGIRTNNHKDNLEWCTSSYNNLHSIHVLGRDTPSGSNHVRSKQVVSIAGVIYPTITQAALHYGLHREDLSAMLNGRKNNITDLSFSHTHDRATTKI